MAFEKMSDKISIWYLTQGVHKSKYHGYVMKEVSMNFTSLHEVN